MMFTAEDWWVIGTALMTAWACIIPGTFLFLRRMALLSDAISHGILPGIIVAFILTADRSALPMILGATAAGILTAASVAFLSNSRTMKSDAAMGVVFPTFFAAGVLLISWKARDVDLDPGCVLYGLLEFVPFDVVSWGSWEIPRAFLNVFFVLIANLVFLLIFYKELVLSSFDPALSRALGFSSRALEYGLLFSLTATAVVAFEAIGSILVLTFLVAPVAASVLLSSRVSGVLASGALISVVAVISGYAGAVAVNTSAAGMMSTALGVCFLMVLLFAPREGILAKILSRTELRLRIAREDLLASLYKELPIQERKRQRTTDKILLYIGSKQLITMGLTTKTNGSTVLTDKGRAEAAQVVRAHRLWEAYLDRHTGLPSDHLHAPSDRVEHFIGERLQDELAHTLNAETDPHGRKIPR